MYDPVCVTYCVTFLLYMCVPVSLSMKLESEIKNKQIQVQTKGFTSDKNTVGRRKPVWVFPVVCCVCQGIILLYL